MRNGDKVNYAALWLWARSSPRRMLFLLRVNWHRWRAQRRRRRQQSRMDAVIPPILAIGPTMRCNYRCKACYSRGRSEENELSTYELDALFSEAEELGVDSIVLTGGDPLLRDDMLDLTNKHRGLLFFLITNGSLMTPEVASRIAKSGNVVALVSIEGSASFPDERRQPGAHMAAIRAFGHLRRAGVAYGFVATNTAVNTREVATNEFIDQMVGLGCVVGFFTEYVPCGVNPRPDWILGQAARTWLREQVLDFRRRKPIVLSHFPDDEYGKENRCSRAGRSSLHISAQGDVEPCPFVPVACENIRNGGLMAACWSPFLCAIRDHPELLRRERYACSLLEHRAELDEVARRFSECSDKKG